MSALKRIAIVGEDNPLSNDPSDALVPWPRLCAGHRLLGILGISEDEYLAMDRRNLCNPTWDTRSSRENAAAILHAANHDAVIALGAKVSTAFNAAMNRREKFQAFHVVSYSRLGEPHATHVIHLPHPSGRNTIWTSEAARHRALDVLREHIPGVAWGSVQHR